MSDSNGTALGVRSPDLRLQRIVELPTRDELWGTCPFGFTGPKRDHAWLETTLPGDTLRTFGCDCCEARASEFRPTGEPWV